MTTLMNLSPLDGRYHSKSHALKPILSEYGLIKNRTFVEIEWFKALSNHAPLTELPCLPKTVMHQLDAIIELFNIEDAQAIKVIEKTTNHDLKAVEYFLKQRFETITELALYREFIHFGCTSEDINNLAYALMLKDARDTVLLPVLDQLTNQLRSLAQSHHDTPMMARTHGQPASPTTLGKEIVNVIARLERQINKFQQVEILGKINGAVGNYNAHLSAYPELNWQKFTQHFVESLGLTWNPLTTQIEPHDWISEYLDILTRLNTILIDFSRDVWGYISLGYFVQKAQPGEVGSSTMPHKINPIDFENAEGNMGIANALLTHLSQALPISRFQRDLTDSTRLRNLGPAIGHGFIAYQSILKGLNSLSVNKTALENDLNQNWALLAEPIQTVMRRYGISEPYEKLKVFTRGKTIDKHNIQLFIEQLDLPVEAKKQLKQLCPTQYTGSASAQAGTFLNKVF